MKRDTQVSWLCYHCNKSVIDHDDTVVVAIDRDFAFFHQRCYRQWVKEKQDHHHLGTLGEGFG